MAMLSRESLLTRAKLHGLYYDQVMDERKLRSLKTQLRQVPSAPPRVLRVRSGNQCPRHTRVRKAAAAATRRVSSQPHGARRSQPAGGGDRVLPRRRRLSDIHAALLSRPPLPVPPAACLFSGSAALRSTPLTGSAPAHSSMQYTLTCIRCNSALAVPGLSRDGHGLARPSLVDRIFAQN